MPDIGAAAAGISLAATGLFAGCALFVSAVEVPAAAETGVAWHFKFFPGMYKRAAKLQGGLAFLGSHAAMIAAAKASSNKAERLNWRVAGLLLGAVWPWTVFVMMPVNKTILSQADTEPAKQEQLLSKWSRLHMVRTGLSLSSLAVMVATVLGAAGDTTSRLVLVQT